MPSHDPAVLPDSDWDALFNAVQARLRQAVVERLAATTAVEMHDATQRVQTIVLECATALDQLHVMLAHERARRERADADLNSVRAELVEAQNELAGTRAEGLRVHHLALHDDLTALPNGSFFRERIDRELAGAEPERRALAVLYLDLDGFKAINDMHGHDVGDDVLRIIAARLARTVRADDTVGRLGGDEFACLLTHMPSRARLCRLACELFDAVSAPFKLGSLELSVRTSIGVAVFPADGANATALLKSADLAMYRAKRQQTGYAFFDQRIDA